jgi:uncharacterized Fe-S cluster-containing protein
MSDIVNTTKKVTYKCSNCGKEETFDFPSHFVPEVVKLCPECHFLTFHQVKYDYFRDGPKKS